LAGVIGALTPEEVLQILPKTLRHRGRSKTIHREIIHDDNNVAQITAAEFGRDRCGSRSRQQAR
jgi:hypothetical protein